jgi:hypothetical protein
MLTASLVNKKLPFDTKNPSHFAHDSGASDRAAAHLTNFSL